MPCQYIQCPDQYSNTEPPEIRVESVTATPARSVCNFSYYFICLSITFIPCSADYWFSVAFRHIYWFTASSGVTFFCFITLSTSLSHFISGLPLLYLPCGDQVSIRLGNLLSPTSNICPYNFNVLFSILYTILCVTLILYLMTSFLTFSILDALAALLQKSISVLNSFLFNL
jgi:hypothetical protein